LQLIARILSFSPSKVFRISDLPPGLFPASTGPAVITPQVGTSLWRVRMGAVLEQHRKKRGWTLRDAARHSKLGENRSGEIGLLERNQVWNWPMFFKLMRTYGLSLAPVAVRASSDQKGIVDLLAEGALPGSQTQMSLQELELAHIERVLEQCHGNRSEAARILGISTRTLFNKVSEKKPST